MPIKVAVRGAGYWGPNLIRNFHQIEGSSLEAICDKDAERLEHLGRQYRGVYLTTDYGDLLTDRGGRIDAIVVSLPVEMHYQVAREALKAGKHVFVEKPLAMKSEECLELIHLAEKNKRVLMVGHTFEYNVAVNKIKEYLEAGVLGSIYYIYSQRLNLGRVRQDVNAMWNLAPHDISIILYWLEELPVRVSAQGITHIQEGIEDVVFLNLEFKEDKVVHIHISWLDPNKVRKITIVGSKKMLVYDDVSPDAKIQIYDKGIEKKNLSADMGSYDDFGKFQLIHRAGDIVIPKIDFVEPLRVECSHFIECIGSGTQPRTDGRNGLRVVRILEAAQRSLDSGGETVYLGGK